MDAAKRQRAYGAGPFQGRVGVRDVDPSPERDNPLIAEPVLRLTFWTDRAWNEHHQEGAGKECQGEHRHHGNMAPLPQHLLPQGGGHKRRRQRQGGDKYQKDRNRVHTGFSGTRLCNLRTWSENNL